MYKKGLWLWVSILGFHSQSLLAQADTLPKGRWGVLPMPTVASSPETGWYAGALAMLTYNPQDAAGTRSSNGKVEFKYTQNRQWVLESNWNIFTTGNRSNYLGEVQWLYFPENFWGIGGNSPAEAEERYAVRRVEVVQQANWQVRPNVFAGPVFRLQYLYDVQPAVGGTLADGQIAGSSGGLSSGLGYRIAHDSRQNPLNAKQGALLLLQQIAFGPALGSDFSFTSTALEGRTYLPIGKKHTLAWQGLVWLSTGEPPFRMLSMMGGNQRLRGYYFGRFRDRHFVMTQAEYRAPLWWRLGVVGFAGIGNVGPTLMGLADSPWKPSTGFGLRLLTDKQEDLNLRIDFAWGRESFEFYLSFGEAF